MYTDTQCTQIAAKLMRSIMS